MSLGGEVTETGSDRGSSHGRVTYTAAASVVVSPRGGQIGKLNVKSNQILHSKKNFKSNQIFFLRKLVQIFFKYF